MTEDGPPVFVVHGLAHLSAVLEAARAKARPATVMTAPGASAYAGPSWFAALVAAGRADYPAVELTAILDCGDRAGDALGALKLGLAHIVFTGHPEALARLRAIAAAQGAEILDRRPASFDLLDRKDAAEEATRRV
jgi:hypothetical protein